MQYKNTSGSHLQISEHRFVAPSATVELSKDNLKTPLVKKLIAKGWLSDLGETALGDFINNEINNVTNTHPDPSPIDFNVNITFPVGKDAYPDAEPPTDQDNVYVHKNIDSVTEYGNIEHNTLDDVVVMNAGTPSVGVISPSKVVNDEADVIVKNILNKTIVSPAPSSPPVKKSSPSKNPIKPGLLKKTVTPIKTQEIKSDPIKKEK
jgi:hypothetical protein